MNPLKYAQMMKYLTRAKKEKPDLPDVFPASKAPIPPVRKDVETMDAINAFIRANPRKDMAGGGFITKLYRGVKGLQQGKIEKELINKYRGQGMDLLEAINKANPEANQIVKNRKLKVIQDKFNKTNVLTDDYVKLIDEEIKLNDPELFKDIIKFEKNNRSDLVDKMRALRHPDWAEANFGEDYLDVLQQRQSRAIKQMMDDIDPNVKERTVVDDIDDMNQANIDEFFGRKKNANGGRIDFAGGGMLVQPGFGGVRQGYKDDNLPDFITKTDTGYRVRSKKTKSNPAISANFNSLKDAKAFVRENNLVKSKKGLEFPELVAKAQGVVDNYNNLLDKAVANNDLRNVKFFERYVKDRFKKTSDQNQILRQVYKKKLNYKDLTDARSTVADNLIAEIMKKEKIIAQDAIYERLGGKSGLKGKIIKKISKGLKDQTKIKVNNAVAAIVEADEIIDDSFIKTVANKIGRTQFGKTSADKTEAAWRKALNKNKYYKDNKKLLDYAFTAGAKSTRAPGMSLKEILDDAKYKKGGGVTFSGKQTQFSGLRRYIFDYAKTHWHRNNFDGNPKKSLIEFYDKNGEPIKWKSGLKLKLGEVQFKIPSESNIMWSYDGKPKGSVSVTGPIADKSRVFNEVTETYNVLKDISDAEVISPVTGKKITYNKLVSDIYKKGYGYKGENVFGLDIDHFKGIRNHPFKNLRAMDRRLNISLGAIDKNFDNRNLKSKLKREMLGKLVTTTGSNYNQALKNYFINQATNVLDRGITKTLSASDRLAAKSPYYAAVKNVYEQKNLPKVQKELLEKSYQRATKLEQTLLNNLVANSKLDKCIINRKADGGRIGFALSDECIRDGLNETKKKAAAGDKKAARQLVKTAEVATRGRLLKNVLGPGAILGEAVFEGALIGNKVLGGKPADIAYAESYLSYLDPRKYRGELDPLKMRREDMLESTADKNILQSGFDAQDRISAFNEAREKEELAEIRQRPDQLMTQEEREKLRAYEKQSSPFIQDSSLQKDTDIISSEAFKDASRVAQEYLQGQSGQQQAGFGVFSVPESAQADEGRRVRAMTEMKNLYPQYSDKDILDILEGFDMDPKDYDYTYTPRNFPADTSSKPLTGFDDIRNFYQRNQATQNIADAGGVANLAGGGIAKLAGIDQGPPPVRGPNSQGLLSLKNRVRNY